MHLTEEERAEVRSRPFPVQVDYRGIYGDKTVAPHPTRIPWSVADKAGCAYAARYGKQQSIERLAQRGGLSGGEMDELYSDWRREVDEIESLRETIHDIWQLLQQYMGYMRYQHLKAQGDERLKTIERIAGEYQLCRSRAMEAQSVTEATGLPESSDDTAR